MLVAAVALCASAPPAFGQVEWQIDAAASRVKPVGAVARSALSVSAQAQQEFGAFKPLINASATLTGDSVAAAQLYVGVRTTPPWNRRMPLDLGGVFALYGIAAGERGQSRALYVRQHGLGTLGRPAGWWIGGALAQIERSSSFSSHAFDVGGWIARGRTQYLLALSTSRTDDRELFRSSALVPDEFARAFRVADATVGFEHARTFVEVEAVGGLRTALEGLDGSRAFGAVSLRYRLHHLVNVLVSAGSQLADPLRGTPEWRYVAVGLRIGNARPRIARPSGIVGPVLRFDRLSGAVRLFVDAPDAHSIAIIGTMTGWEPRELEHTPQGWTITLPASPGGHQIQVRVNAGPWLPPAGLTSVNDEFGRRVGYFVLH